METNEHRQRISQINMADCVIVRDPLDRPTLHFNSLEAALMPNIFRPRALPKCSLDQPRRTLPHLRCNQLLFENEHCKARVKWFFNTMQKPDGHACCQGPSLVPKAPRSEARAHSKRVGKPLHSTERRNLGMAIFRASRAIVVFLCFILFFCFGGH